MKRNALGFNMLLAKRSRNICGKILFLTSFICLRGLLFILTFVNCRVTRTCVSEYSGSCLNSFCLITDLNTAHFVHHYCKMKSFLARWYSYFKEYLPSVFIIVTTKVKPQRILNTGHIKKVVLYLKKACMRSVYNMLREAIFKHTLN